LGIATPCATRSGQRTSRRRRARRGSNGDLVNKVISVFQIVKDPPKPLDDVAFQYKYSGVAPRSA